MNQIPRKHRRRRRWVVLISISLLVGAAYLLGWSNVFSVKNVVVLGAPSASEALLIKNSIPIGEKLARMESKQLNSTLEGFPWLARSGVSANWLNGVVTVHVWTRNPVAIIDSKLIDETGKIFDLPGYSYHGLPSVIAPTSAARLFAAKLVVDLPQQLRASLVTITTVGNHSARLVVTESSFVPPRSITIIWGDSSDNELKGRVYQSLIALPENKKVSLVDVSAPHAPIVK